MKTYLKKLHRILYLISVLFFFVVAFPVLWLLARNPKKYYNQIVFLRKWISLLGAYCVGFRFHVNYETEIDWSKNYVICPNHTSILDITVLTYLCPQPFSFMGKIELLKNPVTRIFFKSIDIAVDRNSKISSYKAFKKGNDILMEGKNLVVFPEGKIDDEFPPKLHPFKAGPFKMATENKIAIIPVIIHNAWQILWDDGARFGSKPGTIMISVLKPIDSQKAYPNEFNSIEEELYTKMNSCWLTSKSKI